jgi:hypothetical protein
VHYRERVPPVPTNPQSGLTLSDFNLKVYGY